MLNDYTDFALCFTLSCRLQSQWSDISLHLYNKILVIGN